MRRLRKSDRDRVLFGVSGGLGEYFELDPVLVRVGFVALCFAGGIGFVLYVLLALFIPMADAPEGSPTDALQDNVEHMADEAAEAGRRLGSAMGPAEGQRRRSTMGIIFIAVGGLILLSNIGVFFWWRWDIFWPALFIVIGILMFAKRPRASS